VRASVSHASSARVLGTQPRHAGLGQVRPPRPGVTDQLSFPLVVYPSTSDRARSGFDSDERASPAPRLRGLVLWLAGLTTGMTALLLLGRGPLATPPFLEPDLLGHWLHQVGTASAVAALLRVVALAVGAWLGATTVASLVFRAVGWARAGAVCEILSPPVVRRLTLAALGLGVTVAASTSVARLAPGASPSSLGRGTPPQAVVASVAMASPSDGRATRPTPERRAVTATWPRGARVGRSASDRPSREATGGVAHRAEEPGPTSPDLPPPPVLVGLDGPPRVAPADRTARLPEDTQRGRAPTERKGGMQPDRSSPTSIRSADTRLPPPERRPVPSRLFETPLGGGENGEDLLPRDPSRSAADHAGRPQPKSEVESQFEPVVSRLPAADRGYWVVRPGDDLWTIAEATLESAGLRPTPRDVAAYVGRLEEANRPRFLRPNDPNLIFAGQVLLLPKISTDATS